MSDQAARSHILQSIARNEQDQEAGMEDAMIHEDEDVYITRRGEVLLKQQCTFEFNGMRCGLKEGHEGAHISEEALEANALSTFPR